MKALSSLAILSLALFLTSCSLTQQVENTPADTAAPQPQADSAAATKSGQKAEAPTPTNEQQKAAEELLNAAPAADAAPQAAPAPEPETQPAPMASESGLPLPSGGLRMGSIIPQEDPTSVGDAPPPTANSVELRGLRSPKMPSKLPMGIDGKLESAQ